MIRTVLPRPKGYGALGVLGGLMLTAGIVWGWRAMLPPVQGANLFLYAKTSVLRVVSVDSFISRKPGKVSRHEYVEKVLRTQVYGDKGVLLNQK